MAICLPSGLLPHAEASASPGSEILGVPSLLCTRVSFELCAYTRIPHNADYGKFSKVLRKFPIASRSPRGHVAVFLLATCALAALPNTLAACDYLWGQITKYGNRFTSPPC